MQKYALVGAFVGSVLVACGAQPQTEPVTPPTQQASAQDAEQPEPAAEEGRTPGRLAPELIQKVVRDNYPTMKNCYVEAQKTDPTVEGKFVASFRITPEGKLVELDTSKSTLEDGPFLKCVSDVFLGLEFPKPEGGDVTVVYPIHFSPDEPVSGDAPETSDGE